MSEISGEWAGRITGTNNANVFAEFSQSGVTVHGTVRINDPVHGTAVYKIAGSVSGETLQVEMHPDKSFFDKQRYQKITVNNQTITVGIDPASGYGVVTVNANIHGGTHIEGTWKSTIGTGGKVFLDRVQPATISPSQAIDERSKTKRTVFISYSHKDANHLDRLRVHLKPLEKLGLVEVWDDTKIKVGDHWEKEIEGALKRSGVAVLIISADFLASDFIVDNELPPILEKAQLEGTKIVPVILKPCRFSRDANLAKFHALNPPDKPVQAMSDTEQEEIWDRLSQIIEAEID